MPQDELDRRIIAALQGDLPLVPRPFQVIAENLGMEETDLIRRLQGYVKRGWLRRLGAILYHRRVGVRANLMCAWKVPPERVKEVGQYMASFPQISHCYERRTYSQWPYNLYTMIHGCDEGECQEVIRKIALETGIQDYVALRSIHEFKKTSMRYIDEGDLDGLD